jgi:hypothetical protein
MENRDALTTRASQTYPSPLQWGGQVGNRLHVTINEPLIANVDPILTPALSLNEREFPAAALFYSA